MNLDRFSFLPLGYRQNRRAMKCRLLAIHGPRASFFIASEAIQLDGIIDLTCVEATTLRKL